MVARTNRVAQRRANVAWLAFGWQEVEEIDTDGEDRDTTPSKTPHLAGVGFGKWGGTDLWESGPDVHVPAAAWLEKLLAYSCSRDSPQGLQL